MNIVPPLAGEKYPPKNLFHRLFYHKLLLSLSSTVQRNEQNSGLKVEFRFYVVFV